MGCQISKEEDFTAKYYEDEENDNDDPHPWPALDYDNCELVKERKDRPYWDEVFKWKPSESILLVNNHATKYYNRELKEQQQRIVEGHIYAPLPKELEERDTIRIMISSTFQDFVEERNLLLKDVLPYLEEFGAKFGIKVALIEMRWGISDEAVRQNRTIAICLNEVRRCLKESIGQHFCLLLGNRYGYRPAPSVLTIDDFEKANTKAQEEQNHQVQSILRKLYQIDENLVPPAYVLVRPEGYKHSSSRINFKKINTFEQDEEILVEFLDSPSFTELEAIEGLIGEKVQSKAKNALVYHRNVQRIESKNSFYSDTDPGVVNWETHLEKLNALKEASKKVVQENDGYFRSFDVGSLDPPDFQSYLNEFADDFCHQIVRKIKQIVKRRKMEESSNQRPRIDNPSLLKEIHFHHKYAEQLFQPKGDFVDKLVNHCRNGSGALILRGTRGGGKKNIFARVAKELHKDGILKKRTVVLRFAGLTQESSTSDAIVATMLSQLMLSYPKTTKESLRNVDFLVSNTTVRFQRLIRRLSSKGKRVVLLIDGIDLLSQKDPGRLNLESWLPPLFGKSVLENVALLISTNDKDLVTSLQNLPTSQLLDVPTFNRDEVKIMLDDLCTEHDHNLQMSQRELLLRGFEYEKSTLFLDLAFRQSLEWRSWDLVTVPPTIQGQIEQLFENLKRDLGSFFVRSLISHLTLSNGASWTELRKMVSRDEAVKREVFKYHVPPDGLIPTLIVADIMERLKPYLVLREIDDTSTENWFHPIFVDVTKRAFLSKGASLLIHRDAAEFYEDQPDYKRNQLNVRKLHQIPYHLKKLRDWKSLGDFLQNTPNALFAEASNRNGQEKYAAYWRIIHRNRKSPRVEEVVPKFLNQNIFDARKIIDLGNFMKEYFSAYKKALDLYFNVIDWDQSMDFSNFSDDELECACHIGDTYRMMSEFKEAFNWLQQGYQELVTRNGESDYRSLKSLELLSSLSLAMGNYQEAKQFSQKLYLSVEAKQVENDENLADAARQLGETYYILGEYNEALRYIKTNYKISNVLYGHGHPRTADALVQIGKMNKILGYYEQAIQKCEEAEKNYVDIYGRNHNSTAAAIQQIGQIYHRLGLYDKALRYLNEALVIKKSILRSNNVAATNMATIKTCVLIGKCLHDKGDDLIEVKRFLEQNLKDHDKYFRKRHPDIANLKSILADLYSDLGQFEDGLRLAQEALNIRKETIGNAHLLTAFTHDTLAKIYIGLGQIDSADIHANESMQIRLNALGYMHPYNATACLTKARILRLQNNIEEAKSLASRAHGLQVKLFGENHPKSLKTKNLVDDLVRESAELL